MKLLLTVAMLAVVPLAAQEAERPKLTKWEWASVGAVAAAHAFDIHSSMGRQELNPMYRGPDGRFSPAKGIGVKVSISAVRMGLTWMVVRRKPHARDIFLWTNLLDAGVTGGMAARNYRIH